jgi:amidase
VFIVKTTLPQAIMHLETDSFYGPTVNPYNRILTAGGSSGGEGALIAGGGSVLGYGR